MTYLLDQFIVYFFNMAVQDKNSPCKKLQPLIALFCKKIFGTKFIFDMRGFWADERVDGDIWKKMTSFIRLQSH